jgi:hypothetical protein
VPNDLDKKIRRVSLKAGASVWFKTRCLLKWTKKAMERPDYTEFDVSKVIERLFKTLLTSFEPTDEVKSQIEAVTLGQIMDVIESKFSESPAQADSSETS